MFSHLVYGIFCTVIYGSRYAFGTQCNEAEMGECIAKYHQYEEKTFPYYGKDADELDDACSAIHWTTLCPQKFVTCVTDDECDPQCKITARTVDTLKEHSSLPNFYQKFCQGETPLRTRYLEHAGCLHDPTGPYEGCYNTSLESLMHVASNSHLRTMETKCCLFSWTHQCYTDKTRETCGAEAASLVFDVFNVLREGIEEQCESYEKCDTPPLPGSDGETGVPPLPTTDSPTEETPTADLPTAATSKAGQLSFFDHSSVIVLIVFLTFTLSF